MIKNKYFDSLEIKDYQDLNEDTSLITEYELNEEFIQLTNECNLFLNNLLFDNKKDSILNSHFEKLNSLIKNGNNLNEAVMDFSPGNIIYKIKDTIKRIIQFFIKNLKAFINWLAKLFNFQSRITEEAGKIASQASRSETIPQMTKEQVDEARKEGAREVTLDGNGNSTNTTATNTNNTTSPEPESKPLPNDVPAQQANPQLNKDQLAQATQLYGTDTAGKNGVNFANPEYVPTSSGEWKKIEGLSDVNKVVKSGNETGLETNVRLKCPTLEQLQTITYNSNKFVRQLQIPFVKLLQNLNRQSRIEVNKQFTGVGTGDGNIGYTSNPDSTLGKTYKKEASENKNFGFIMSMNEAEQATLTILNSFNGNKIYSSLRSNLEGEGASNKYAFRDAYANAAENKLTTKNTVTNTTVRVGLELDSGVMRTLLHNGLLGIQDTNIANNVFNTENEFNLINVKSQLLNFVQNMKILDQNITLVQKLDEIIINNVAKINDIAAKALDFYKDQFTASRQNQFPTSEQDQKSLVNKNIESARTEVINNEGKTAGINTYKSLGELLKKHLKAIFGFVGVLNSETNIVLKATKISYIHLIEEAVAISKLDENEKKSIFKSCVASGASFNRLGKFLRSPLGIAGIAMGFAVAGAVVTVFFPPAASIATAGMSKLGAAAVMGAASGTIAGGAAQLARRTQQQQQPQP